MAVNCNISVLPFYKSKDLWNSRKWYAFGRRYKLLCPANRLLPFQFTVPSGDGTPEVTALESYDADTGEMDSGMDYLSMFAGNGGNVTDYSDEYGSSSNVVFPSAGTHDAMPLGWRYLKMTVGGEDYYSEEFCVVPSDMYGTTLVEWGNADDITMTGSVIKADAGNDIPFVNMLYLEAADVSRPEYLFEEEIQRRNGFDFPERQLSEKRYRFTCLLPEYVLDAFRAAPMADMLRVTDRHGLSYQVDHMSFDVEWTDGGDLAIVTVEFETDTAIFKVGRGQFADYNNDYLNDFFNGD